ncbi:hypothetical protein BUALT_Bualt16G0038200 [Buddleja alternifolia]|uniref:Reverse transcriptase n=1 Tax=Buddleja alternifolia TaxID=168488 RepID=A0AAV6WFE2_9LAMI|nr:hypothetical protein BUALT_Bualt16G0038200 [Buddleja alternifolia]
MYADDLLIFGKANRDNIDCIADCIAEYERWSGQLVSTEKSVIHFSKTVPRQARRDFCSRVGFRECNHKCKHLGLPFCRPATRVRDFDDLIERIGKKLSGWKAKCLAHVGRNVLIKGVAQSIPIYFMSLYDIPSTVCEILDRKMKKFWWGDKDENNHIRHTRTWSDPWIPTLSGFRPTHGPADDREAAQTYLVKNFIDQGTLSWDLLALNRVFQPLVVAEIVKIRIPTCVEPQRILWTPSKNGKFWVSSTYNLDNSERFLTTRRGDPQFWKRFWKAPIHERFKMFLWRILVKAIPSGAHLHKIIPEIDPICIMCHGEEETEEHVFIKCPAARNAWWRSKWGIRTDNFVDKNMFDLVSILLDHNNQCFPNGDFHMEFLQFSVCLMELLWKNRNNRLHGNECDSIDKIVELADKKAQDHLKVQLAKRMKKQVCEDAFVPMNECLIVNIDAAYKDGVMCSGVVVRDSAGNFLFAAANSNSAVDARDAELQAIWDACVWLEKAHFPNIQFANDCLGAIQGILNHQEAVDWKYEILTLDIRAFFGFKPGWSLNFIASAVARRDLVLQATEMGIIESAHDSEEEVVDAEMCRGRSWRSGSGVEKPKYTESELRIELVVFARVLCRLLPLVFFQTLQFRRPCLSVAVATPL